MDRDGVAEGNFLSILRDNVEILSNLIGKAAGVASLSFSSIFFIIPLSLCQLMAVAGHPALGLLGVGAWLFGMITFAGYLSPTYSWVFIVMSIIAFANLPIRDHLDEVSAQIAFINQCDQNIRDFDSPRIVQVDLERKKELNHQRSLTDSRARFPKQDLNATQNR